MIKAKLQIRKDSLLPYAAAVLAIISGAILFFIWRTGGIAAIFCTNAPFADDVLSGAGWLIQVIGVGLLAVFLFSLAKKSLTFLLIPIGFYCLGLVFLSMTDGCYWIFLVFAFLVGWSFWLAASGETYATRHLAVGIVIASLAGTLILCIPDAVKAIEKISPGFETYLCWVYEGADGAEHATWNITYLIHEVTFLAAILLTLFATTRQFVAETEEVDMKKHKAKADAKGHPEGTSDDPFEAMKKLYNKMDDKKPETGDKKEETPVYRDPEPEVMEKTEPKTAAEAVDPEPVVTVPVSGSRLQKSLKEEIVYDRDQKLEHRNVVRVFSVIGMVISFLMLVGGVLLLTDVISLQYNSICGIMLIAVGVGLFCVFGNNVTYKEYYMKTIVTERKVVHEESNWEEVLANRLEEDEKSIASLSETYARMTEMYAKLLESTAELSSHVKALGMKAPQQALEDSSTERTAAAEETAATPVTDPEEEIRRIREELRAMDEAEKREEEERAAREAKAREQALAAKAAREAEEAEAARLAEEARRAEEERLAEEERQRIEEEATRLAEEETARLAEEARIAEEEAVRLAEEARIAEEAKKAEAARAAEEETRLAEEARIAEEAKAQAEAEAEALEASGAAESAEAAAEEQVTEETQQTEETAGTEDHIAHAFAGEYNADEVARAYQEALAEGFLPEDFAESFRPKPVKEIDYNDFSGVIAEEEAARAAAAAAATAAVAAETTEEPAPAEEAVEEAEETVEEITEAAEAVEEAAETVEEAAEEAVESAEEAAEEAAGEVTGAIEEVTEAAEENIEETVEAAEETAAEAVESAEEAAMAFAEAVEEPAEEIAEAAGEAVEEVSDAAEEIAETAEDTVEEAIETAEDAVEAVTDTAEENIEEAAEAAEETAEEAVESAEEAAMAFAGAFEEPAEEIAETAEEISDAAEEVAETAEEAATQPVIEATPFSEDLFMPVFVAGTPAKEEPVKDTSFVEAPLEYEPMILEEPAAEEPAEADEEPAAEEPVETAEGPAAEETAEAAEESEPEDEYLSFEDYLYGGRAEDTPEEEPKEEEPNPEDIITPEEEEEIGLYGKKPVSTEREILEDFVIPTFRGFGFDATDETEEPEESEDYYNPNGYKLKSFAKKTEPAWMSEDDDDEDFVRPEALNQMPLSDTFDDADEDDLPKPAPELPKEKPEFLMDDEPALPMDDEPELPMDEEPELPMDDEPETPVYDEPEAPVYDEPEVPSFDEPEALADEEPSVPQEEPEAPAYEDSGFTYYAAPEIPLEDEPEVPAEEEPEVPQEEPELPSYDEPGLPGEEEDVPADEAPAPVKTDDDDRLRKLKEKLAQIRQRNSEKYGDEEQPAEDIDFF